MKLLRFGEAGRERPGLIDGEGHIRDLSGHVADIDGASLGPAVLKRLAQVKVGGLPVVAGTPRIGANLRAPLLINTRMRVGLQKIIPHPRPNITISNLSSPV